MRKVSLFWVLALGVIAAVAVLQVQRGFSINSAARKSILTEVKVVADESAHEDASKAQKDLDSYFDAIPTASVNAFHEPELQGNSNYGGVESEGHLRSKDATSDLLDYFSKVPTHNVNAFHEPNVGSSKTDGKSQEHVRVKFSAGESRSDLSDYFVHIPTHEVNAYHEPPTSQAQKQQGLMGTTKITHKSSINSKRSHFRKGMAASEARREMASYFMQIPTKNVAADHTLRPLRPSPAVAKTLETAAQVLHYMSEYALK
jgi:hypothetical protein